MPALQPKASHFGLILPLCTSSATLGLALFQYPLFNAYLQKNPSTNDDNNNSIAGRPLSAFWAPFIKQGGAIIAVSALTSTIAGVLSARWLHTHATLETTDVSNWYYAGAVLAAAHFVFLPFEGPLVKRMVEAGGSALSEGDVEERNRREMERWFVWHTVRTVLVDVPALWCFAEGVALSFWVI